MTHALEGHNNTERDRQVCMPLNFRKKKLVDKEVGVGKIELDLANYPISATKNNNTYLGLPVSELPQDHHSVLGM